MAKTKVKKRQPIQSGKSRALKSLNKLITQFNTEVLGEDSAGLPIEDILYGGKKYIKDSPFAYVFQVNLKNQDILLIVEICSCCYDFNFITIESCFCDICMPVSNLIKDFLNLHGVQNEIVIQD